MQMQHNWLRLKYDIPVSEKICTPHARCMAKTVFLVYCYLTLVWYAILFLVHLNCYSIVLFFYFYFTYGYLQLPFSFSKPLFILHFRKPALQISNSTVWLSEFMLKSTTTFYFFFSLWKPDEWCRNISVLRLNTLCFAFNWNSRQR